MVVSNSTVWHALVTRKTVKTCVSNIFIHTVFTAGDSRAEPQCLGSASPANVKFGSSFNHRQTDLLDVLENLPLMD